MGIDRIITERQLASEHVHHEREHAQRLIQSSLDGILAFDHECRYTIWNTGMERITGVAAAEALGKCAFDVFSFLKDIGEDAYFFDALAGKEGIVRDRPYTIPATGRAGFFEAHYAPLYAETGDIMGGLATIRDTTEHKQTLKALQRSLDELERRVDERTHELSDANACLQRQLFERERAEAALRESEERFRILFEHSPDAILLFDPHHPEVLWPIVECNPAASRINGYTRQELIGQSVGLLSTGQPTREGCTAFLERLRCEGTIYSETVHRRKDGTLFPIEFSTSLITLGGRELVLGIDREITLRKQAEAERAAADALRQSDELKTQFLANVSHELRTPLHHIKGYASTLLQRGMHFDQQTRQEFLQIVCDESDKLVRLIDDLLNTAKLESGTFSLDIDSVQVDELVRSAVKHWQGIERHQFEAIIPARVPPIPADAHRLQQVLDNLLSNVVRYTPPNTCTTVRLQITNEELVVAVSDDGPGVPAEHIPFVFDRFYRAAASGPSRGGTGLGLFICKGIVEAHGGRIWVEATPGSGTTFRFSLPRRRTVSMFRTTPPWQESVSDDRHERAPREGTA